jgi:hypothetical protein
MDQQEGKDSKKGTYGLLGERRIKKDNMEQDPGSLVLEGEEYVQYHEMCIHCEKVFVI